MKIKGSVKLFGKMKEFWGSETMEAEIDISAEELARQLDEQGYTDIRASFIKPKPTCEHEWDFTGKWICIKCKKVRESVDVLGNPEPKPEQIELLPKDAPYIDHIMNRMCEKINELIRAYNKEGR